MQVEAAHVTLCLPTALQSSSSANVAASIIVRETEDVRGTRKRGQSKHKEREDKEIHEEEICLQQVALSVRHVDPDHEDDVCWHAGSDETHQPPEVLQNVITFCLRYGLRHMDEQVNTVVS